MPTSLKTIFSRDNLNERVLLSSTSSSSMNIIGCDAQDEDERELTIRSKIDAHEFQDDRKFGRDTKGAIDGNEKSNYVVEQISGRDQLTECQRVMIDSRDQTHVMLGNALSVTEKDQSLPTRDENRSSLLVTPYFDGITTPVPKQKDLLIINDGTKEVDKILFPFERLESWVFSEDNGVPSLTFAFSDTDSSLSQCDTSEHLGFLQGFVKRSNAMNTFDSTSSQCDTSEHLGPLQGFVKHSNVMSVVCRKEKTSPHDAIDTTHSVRLAPPLTVYYWPYSLAVSAGSRKRFRAKERATASSVRLSNVAVGDLLKKKPARVQISLIDNSRVVASTSKVQDSLAKNVLADLMYRPVLMRQASKKFSQEEGIEIADLVSETRKIHMYSNHCNVALAVGNSPHTENKISGKQESNYLLSHTFDETVSHSRINHIFTRTDIPGPKKRGSNAKKTKTYTFYDPWHVMEGVSDKIYGYSGGFMILGTSADDRICHPHVLTPPIMESLLPFVPECEMDSNFWLKYSLVRDGGCLRTFLDRANGSKYTFVAIETTEGEVFGAFTTDPWHVSRNYFGGNGCFLWRLHHSRKEQCTSVIDEAVRESKIDVFPFTQETDNAQLCSGTKIIIGGGIGTTNHRTVDDKAVGPCDWGFGLAIHSDFRYGTSSPCLSFLNPSLSKIHIDGSKYEISNLELWALTPCTSVSKAAAMEDGKSFLVTHGSF